MTTTLMSRGGVLTLPGVYRAIVTTTDDPENKGRVKLKVPQLFGDDETDWALPSNPLGIAQVPAIKTTVWVLFEGGDPSFPVYIGAWKQSGTPVLFEGGAVEDIPPGSLPGSSLEDFTIGVRKYNDSTHHFDPPVLLSNSPSAGFISWSAFTMVYKGQAYVIAAGNANGAFVYWHYGDTFLTGSATLPTLTVDDCLVFINKGGIAANAQTAQAIDGSLIVSGSIFANAIAAGSIGTAQLAANSITATQISAGAINGMTITGNTISGASITGTTINGGTITGTTINGGTIVGGSIVGATFATASSGGRVSVTSIGGVGYIYFYSGDAAELQPANILAGTSGTGGARQPSLWLFPGIYNSADIGTSLSTSPAFIALTGDPVTSGTQNPIAWISSRGGVLITSRSNSSVSPQVSMDGTGPTGSINITGDVNHNGSGNMILDTNTFKVQGGWTTTSDYVNINNASGSATLHLVTYFGAVSASDGANFKPFWASAFTVMSNAASKRDVEELSSPLDDLLKLRPVRHRMRKSAQRPLTPDDHWRWHHEGYHRSLIAEEVKTHIPEAVSPMSDPWMKNDGAQGLSMMSLLSTAIGAIKELHAKVEVLEGKVK